MNNNILLFIVAAFALSIQSCKDHSIQYGNNGRAGKYVDIRGIKMYCEIYGNGKPLLMIHGNGGSIRSFNNIIPFYSKNYKIVLTDSRAQGKSVDGNDSLNFEMMADDEAALLQALQIDSAYVIGWSDGGIAALMLAMRHPDKVKKLAATGANLWPDSTAIKPQQWLSSKYYHDSLKNKVWPNAVEKNDWKLFMLDWAQPHLSLASLRGIKCPALVVAGEHDIINENHTREIAKSIPDSRLWIVPNAGHSTFIDQKDSFNKRVDEFFKAP